MAEGPPSCVAVYDDGGGDGCGDSVGGEGGSEGGGTDGGWGAECSGSGI